MIIYANAGETTVAITLYGLVDRARELREREIAAHRAAQLCREYVRPKREFDESGDRRSW